MRLWPKLNHGFVTYRQISDRFAVLLLSPLIVPRAFPLIKPITPTTIFIATFLILYKGSLRETLPRPHEPVAFAQGARLKLYVVETEEKGEVAAREGRRVVALVAAEGELGPCCCREEKKQREHKQPSHRILYYRHKKHQPATHTHTESLIFSNIRAIDSDDCLTRTWKYVFGV